MDHVEGESKSQALPGLVSEVLAPNCFFGDHQNYSELKGFFGFAPGLGGQVYT